MINNMNMYSGIHFGKRLCSVWATRDHILAVKLKKEVDESSTVESEVVKVLGLDSSSKVLRVNQNQVLVFAKSALHGNQLLEQFKDNPDVEVTLAVDSGNFYSL
jgi:putative ubiquitin-RnfH superfamily antitoxin RatB of RatAB toxin-antitoxin module